LAAVLAGLSGLQAQPTSLDVTAGTSPVTEGGNATFTFTLDSAVPDNETATLDIILAVSEDFVNFKSASHFVAAGAGVVFEPNPLTNILTPQLNTRTLTSGISSYELTISTADDTSSEASELVVVIGAQIRNTNVGFAGQPPYVCIDDNDGGAADCSILTGGNPDPDETEVTVRYPPSTSSLLEGFAAFFQFERTAPGDLPELSVEVQVDATPAERFYSSELGSQMVTFKDSGTLATLSVRTVNDTVFRENGQVTVTILPGEGYTVGDPATATYAVHEDDGDAPPNDDDDDNDGGDDDDDDGDDDVHDDGGGGDGWVDFSLAGAECGPKLCVTQTGTRVVAENTTRRSVSELLWRTSDGQTGTRERFRPAWSEPGYYTLSLRVKTADGFAATRTRRIVVRPSSRAGICEPGAERHCFLDERFAVEVQWISPDGEASPAKNVYEGTNDTGLFWFLEEDNWELLIKVLDGCDVNGHHWVYGAATTDLGYVIEVTDTKTQMKKQYRNQAGSTAPALVDSKAFPDSCEPATPKHPVEGAGGVPRLSALPLQVVETQREGTVAVPAARRAAASAEGSCEASEKMMCLQNERYAVTIEWETLEGTKGQASVAVPRTGNSGLFYFFNYNNWEVLLKVLDGCGINEHHWVYAAAATDLGYKITVTDTTLPDDGNVLNVREYFKEPGSPSPALTSSDAFPDACGPWQEQ
jgi:hypothetical protein